MNKTFWGKSPENEDIYTYELKCGELHARVMDYGANLLSLYVPDKNGKIDDVVLGFDSLEDYFTNPPSFGAAVTPVGNRIGKAKFTLNGKEYTLDQNDGQNNLHSGFHPFQRRLWTVLSEEDESITFSIDMKDMEIGFPGNLHMEVTYSLLPDGSLCIDYLGQSDADTLYNPTNHSYFNLNGHDSGSIMDHLVWINSDEFTFADEEAIPDGTIRSVEGTPMDFREPHTLAERVDTDYDELNWAGGYDHNYILKQDIPATEYDEDQITMFKVASFESKESGRKMEVFTELPGMQLYCGNFLTGDEVGKGGKHYGKRHGCCFETQFYPNAINVDSFAKPIVHAGEIFLSKTVYKFSAS